MDQQIEKIIDLLTRYPSPWPAGGFEVLRARLDRAKRQDRSGWEDARQEAVLAVLAAAADGVPAERLELIASAAIERGRYKPGSRLAYSDLRDSGGKKVRLPRTEVSEASAERVGAPDTVLETADTDQRIERLRAETPEADRAILEALLDNPAASVRELQERLGAGRRRIERIRAAVGDMARDMQLEAGLQRFPYVADTGPEYSPAQQEAELEAIGLAMLTGRTPPKRRRAENLRFGTVPILNSGSVPVREGFAA